MPMQLTKRRNKRKTRREINIHQNAFPKAYISTIDNSRRSLDSLSDMTNMEMVQDNVVRPRPPLVRYGIQPAYPVVGRGEYRYNGQRGLLWMLNVAGVGKIYKQLDGQAYTLIGGTYDISVWSKFCQSKSKVYPYNSVDNLSFVDLSDNSITTYSALATPVISSVVKAGMAGTTVTHYYRITANNDVGESIASTTVSVQSLKYRENWTTNTDYIDVTWGAVAGATSYTVYYGTSSTIIKELYSVVGAVTFRDLGTLFVNPYRLAPEGNSTEGFVPTWLYNDSKNSQLFGTDSNNLLYYSDTLTTANANFSPFGGGGFVPIDEDGDTALNFVDGFRNGKGDPVITCSSRGAAGKGKLSHVTFETYTAGDQAIIYPNVYEANGQSGTYAPRATIKARDALYYFTGQDVKSTGTSQNIVNILTTGTISQVIEPDLEKINLKALNNAVGVEHKDRLYWALPVNSDTNNEIWYLDLSRKNAWVLRWPIAATDMWLYEDNDGTTHFCVLVDGVILEFTRAGAQTHQDDDVAWRSRVAFDAMVWDKDGITLGNVRNQYFKFLQPKGQIQVNAVGLTRKGVQQSAGSDTFLVTTTFTGYDIWMYDEKMYDADPGNIESFGKSVSVLRIKPKGLLSQLSWEIIGETVGTDYIHSATNTRGWYSEELIMKT